MQVSLQLVVGKKQCEVLPECQSLPDRVSTAAILDSAARLEEGEGDTQRGDLAASDEDVSQPPVKLKEKSLRSKGEHPCCIVYVFSELLFLLVCFPSPDITGKKVSLQCITCSHIKHHYCLYLFQHLCLYVYKMCMFITENSLKYKNIHWSLPGLQQVLLIKFVYSPATCSAALAANSWRSGHHCTNNTWSRAPSCSSSQGNPQLLPCL